MPRRDDVVDAARRQPPVELVGGRPRAAARLRPETDAKLTAQVVGRDAELAAIEDFLQSDGSPQAFVLTGGPGIGKTTLWEAGLDAARQHGVRVLAARGSGAEAQLSFAALTDLL